MSVVADRPREAGPEPGSLNVALVVCDDRGGVLVRNGPAEVLLGTDGRGDGGVEAENADRLDRFLDTVLSGPGLATRERIDLRDPATGLPMTALAAGFKILDDEGRLQGALCIVTFAEDPDGGGSNAAGSAAAGRGSWACDRRRGPAPERPSVNYLGKGELEVVSHELRTPLNAVVGYATLLEESLLGEISEEQVRAVRRIKSAAQQLLAAVNHALLVAHIELGDFNAGDFASGRGRRSDRAGGNGPGGGPAPDGPDRSE